MPPKQMKPAVKKRVDSTQVSSDRVQGFGALLVTDSAFQVMTHVSENLAALFGLEGKDLLGASPRTLFSDDIMHRFYNVLSHETISNQRELLQTLELGGCDYQMTVHRRPNQVIVELVPEQSSLKDRMLPVTQAQAFLTISLRANDLKGFFREGTERLRAITGMDRVTFYRFLPDGCGEVTAEARHPEVQSFLGVRFPASVVSHEARQRNTHTPIRIMADISASDIAVLALPDADPLDASLAVLRRQKGTHQHYLANMDVGAAMTVPVVVDGLVWGLFVAHHRTPIKPDPSILNAAELVGKLTSVRVQNALENQRQANLIYCNAIASKLVVADDALLATKSYWQEVKASLAKMLRADGVEISLDGVVKTQGETPDASGGLVLRALTAPHSKSPKTFDTLAQAFLGVNWWKTGGAMVITVPGEAGLNLIFYRNRVSSHIHWAGRPEKTDDRATDTRQRQAGTSFDLYLEAVDDKCEEWSAEDFEVAEALRLALSHAFTVQAESKASKQRMSVMVHELNHRMRNILALVLSISEQSRSGAQTVDAYAGALQKRIQALSGAHSLITRSNMVGVVLSDLVALEVMPFNHGAQRVKTSGPNVVFQPGTVSVLALLLHELTSNAARFGALSVEGGRVDLVWTFEEDGVLIKWKEEGGPPVSEPAQSGFGRSIIDGAIPYELKGQVETYFHTSGFEGRFWLPGNLIVEADVDPVIIERLAKPVRASPKLLKKLQELRALVVEDNFIVATTNRQFLRSEGFGVVDAAATLEEATAQLARNSYDFCLLDIDLNGQPCAPLALALAAEKIPFVFVTGYGIEGRNEIDAFKAPMLTKPLDTRALLKVIATLFDR